MKYGFLKVATVSPKVVIGDVAANVQTHIDIYNQIRNNVDIIVFPELSLTGYSCEDLFGQQTLLEDVVEGINNFRCVDGKMFVNAFEHPIVIFGAPLFIKEKNAIYNCAIVTQGDQILGVVPKTYLPNYREFYESRWFFGATGNEPKTIDIGLLSSVPFGTDLLFDVNKDCTIGVEICEDVFAPIPPSSFQALAGATVLINLSASNEIVGKADFRRDFVKGQSGKLLAAYVYCSAGPSESTKDIVFGGHCLIGENGTIIAESDRFIRDTHVLITNIDVERLKHERLLMPQTFGTCANNHKKDFRHIRTNKYDIKNNNFTRFVNAHPFVPNNETMFHTCEDIFNIQVCGLAKRLENVSKDVYIGVSGGLDSTLALLVACKAYDLLGIDRKHIHGITMPGFGTTEKTKNNADKLMEYCKISSKTIDIRATCFEQFKAMGHKPFGIDIEKINNQDNDVVNDFCYQLQQIDPSENDLVFENVQARMRTQLLMSHGFVLGTGDLSEIALGWSTYNGDHMSMYNVNSSIPKTLVKALIEFLIMRKVDIDNLFGDFMSLLLDIVNTPVSPELLPFAQITEDKIGPYELHDFFLYNFMRCGFTPEKILFLAQHAKFDEEYTLDQLCAWLKVFYTRFFNSQFKRDCVPAGPKVGSVSLSPRGDWRMPTEASKDSLIKRVEKYGNEHVQV